MPTNFPHSGQRTGTENFHAEPSSDESSLASSPQPPLPRDQTKEYHTENQQDNFVGGRRKSLCENRNRPDTDRTENEDDPGPGFHAGR